MDDNDRALGRVEGQLAALITQVAASEQSSAAGRAKLYEAVDGLREGIREMQSEVKAMDKRLQAVEPIANDLQRWRERGIGVLIFLSFAVAGLGALITAIWDKALHAIGLK